MKNDYLTRIISSINAIPKEVYFFLIIVDLFGVFWYFGLEKLGTATLLILMSLLALKLFIERRDDNMTEEEKEEEEKVKKEEKKSESSDKDQEDGETKDIFGDLGLPDSEEYNRRLEKALG